MQIRTAAKQPTAAQSIFFVTRASKAATPTGAEHEENIHEPTTIAAAPSHNVDEVRSCPASGLKNSTDWTQQRWGLSLRGTEVVWSSFSPDSWVEFDWVGPADEGEPGVRQPIDQGL